MMEAFLYLEQTKTFNEYLSLFGPLMGDEELSEEPEADINELLKDGEDINAIIPAEDDSTN